MADVLFWSIIGVVGFATISLGVIGLLTYKIKKDVREGTYIDKETKEKLKKQGIKISDYKKELKSGKEVKEVKSHEDYMAELRRMG